MECSVPEFEVEIIPAADFRTHLEPPSRTLSRTKDCAIHAGGICGQITDNADSFALYFSLMPIRLLSPVPLRQTPPLFWWVLGAITLCALLPTAWTALDLAAAALFLGAEPPISAVNWWWVEWINAYVPAAFRTMVLLALLGWIVVSVRVAGRPWRLALAFVVLSGALGPGLLVNSGFKDNWQRARPYQVEPFGGSAQFTRAAVITDQCNNNCSFVSGHVACGFFFASLMLVQRRRQVLWGGVGVVSGLTIGFARMADGAHWLSDVLWAGTVTLGCSWIVWKLLLLVYPPRFGESQVPHG